LKQFFVLSYVGGVEENMVLMAKSYDASPPTASCCAHAPFIPWPTRDHYRKMDHIERLHESKVKGLTRRLTQAENAYAEVNKKLNEMSEKAR
jgi:hypothetical protein